MKDVFTDIYRQNGWKGDQSVSGQGSGLEQTAVIRQELPKLFSRLKTRSVLDIPCGDFYWFKRMPSNLELYIGADVVPELIAANIDAYDNKRREFMVLDITTDELPKVDLVLCRDLLGHFSNSDLQLALNNIKRSGSTYLLATTFPSSFNQWAIETGQWRPLNLAYYCGLPEPLEVIGEGNQMFKDKSLGLWKLNSSQQ